ncbi:MAG: 4-hydroxy-tetrahydrodipicolinate synthase [Bacteroidetes bacterium]|nr:MAG: 4-hydroxy-tetrahydrodipicolinate synthase [Bacteroidota bacterium]
MDKLKGLGVAMVTPFKKDLSIDFEALRKLTSYLIDNGVDYLVVMGTTGESVTLSNEEKHKVLETVRDVNNGRLPVVFGAGSNNTAQLVESLKTIDFSGVDAILSVAPYYNKPTQEGLYQHFTEVANASPVPVVLYNVPGRTSSNILPSTILKLAEHPNIVAVKEASGSFDQFMEIIGNKPDDFLCISGDDGITMPFVAAGGDGLISVVGNAYPRLTSDMVHAALQDDMINARKLHYQILPIIPLLFKEGNPAGVKEIMQMMDICENHVRLPLVVVSESLKNRLSNEFERLKKR